MGLGCGRRQILWFLALTAVFTALVGLGVVVRFAPEHPPKLHAPAVARHGRRQGSAALASSAAAEASASGAIACAANSSLIVGILASPSDRSTIARQTIRDTWARFKTPGHVATIRFLLALDKDGKVPPHLQAEAAAKEDMLFLHTLDKYENLSRKVQLFFQWVTDACPGATFVFKTDDDSFVRLDELAKELQRQPTEQVRDRLARAVCLNNHSLFRFHRCSTGGSCGTSQPIRTSGGSTTPTTTRR